MALAAEVLASTPEVLAPAHTDWLRHTLTVRGPAEAMASFRAAAAGPGVIPWTLDLDRLEEDWFLPLAAPADGERAISFTGARLLARRLREAVAAQHARELEHLARGGRHCPLDLHRLLPVPAAVLALGPDDPASRAWLWAQWGTTRALRRVSTVAGSLDGRHRRTEELVIEFWSADWSPWRALLRLRRNWPELHLELVPHYGDG
ncbi:hypothetical protein [Roseomonas sp. BN140053]|uniref:hypothetical protein n=1 Tax=Roseomonas sp. BN140053 TaxID=3391898 RepID=UPI0039EAD8BC